MIHEIQHTIQKIEDFKKDKYSRSKKNPKHLTLDNYLNKRKIRDKIKDRIFQYFSEGRWLHDSEVEKNNFEHSEQYSRKNRYMEMGRGRLGYSSLLHSDMI